MQGTAPKMVSMLNPTALLPKGALARKAWKIGDSPRLMTILLSSFWQRLQVDGPYLAPRNVVFDSIKKKKRTSLVFQWLKFHRPMQGCVGLIPGWETKIPYALQKKKKKSPKT